MRLLSWMVALCWVAACSDDGVPQASVDTGLADGGSSEAGDGGPAGTAPSTSPPTTSADGGSGTSPGGSTGGSSGAETGGAGTVCEVDTDCVLVNDCCSCTAVHMGDAPPECPVQDCFAPICDAAGIGDIGVQCRFGSCQLTPVDCDPLGVLCDVPAPDCEPGFLPAVEGGCWGTCVPAEACNVVPDCSQCGADQACIEIQGQIGLSFKCEPIPPRCAGTPTCECMGETCEDPFICVPTATSGDLACSCPVC